MQKTQTPLVPKTIMQASQALGARSITSVDLTHACLAAMNQSAADLNAMTHILAEHAIQTAKRFDDELDKGHCRSPLHGMPIVVKDNIDVAWAPTTIGSAACLDRIAANNAQIIQRLESAGAIILAKTNMNEFAAGMCGRNVHFGDVHNPWGTNRSAGGSSSGTGAAVAAGLCMGGIGTDTGGSVRIPAAWCGLVGLRPTQGLLPNAGLFPRAPSLDTAGPMARSVWDTAILLDALTGYSAEGMEGQSYAATLNSGLAGFKLGHDRTFWDRDIAAEVSQAMDSSLPQFENLGASVAPVEVPALRSELDHSEIGRNVLLYEFGLEMERFEQSNTDLKARIGPIVQRELKNYTGVSRDDYERLAAARDPFTTSLRQVFTQVDALIMPAMPTTALSLDCDDAAFMQGRRFMLPFSFAGLPSLVFPIGIGGDGLPIAVQIVGDFYQEAKLLQIAAAYEAATPLPQAPKVYHCSDG